MDMALNDELLLNFEDGTKYFASSIGVGQYSMPLRLVIHKQDPALLSSLISSKAPERINVITN